MTNGRMTCDFQDAVSRGIAGAGLDVVQYGWVEFAFLVIHCDAQIWNGNGGMP